MRLLVLGGTVFLGRHVVAAALARGHEVTLFNRGRHNPELFPAVEKLRGDRAGDLAALRGRRWDAVVDTSGELPQVVRSSAELLADAVERYAFASSISVYADLSRPGVDERAPVGRLEDETVEEVTGATYGPLKARCEEAVERALPGRALVIRPGLIVGPHDPTERFTYWPRRVARGGAVLAPGRPERGVQLIDVRDLAEWIVRAVEERLAGRFNATGPAEPLPMAALLDACRRVSGSDARFVWVDERFLLARGVAPWTELPLWVPETPDRAGFLAVDCRRAIAAGLTFRPVDETVRATLAWDRERAPGSVPPGVGLAPEREEELLRAWRTEQGA